MGTVTVIPMPILGFKHTVMLPIKNIQLTATIPSEMVAAQQQLITWCESKILSINAEAKELYDAVEHAKRSKWKHSTLANQYNRSIRRLTFYQKMKAALLEGYYIVPNFPIQMFAIRTTKQCPKGHSWNYWGIHEQDAQALKINEGEYKNPRPLVDRISELRHTTTNTVTRKSESYPVGWDDLEFPITMAKPEIMQATSRAMALKVFDQIGVFPPTKNDDPVILGQIILKEGYRSKTISFMIAWHLNTNVL